MATATTSGVHLGKSALRAASTYLLEKEEEHDGKQKLQSWEAIGKTRKRREAASKRFHPVYCCTSLGRLPS